MCSLSSSVKLYSHTMSISTLAVLKGAEAFKASAENIKATSREVDLPLLYRYVYVMYVIYIISYRYLYISYACYIVSV